MWLNDSYQDYRFTSSIKRRNNLALRKRRIEKNREEDLKEELEEVMNQKNQTRKEKVSKPYKLNTFYFIALN